MRKCHAHLKLPDNSQVDFEVEYEASSSSIFVENCKIEDWNDVFSKPIEWDKDIEEKLMEQIENDKDLNEEFYKQIGEASWDND
jgi:hypothetical protein